MRDDQFLAFDLGAESGRAVVGTLDGEKLRLEERYRFANPCGRMNGYLQWDLLGQWEQIKAGLRAAAGGVKLAGIGVDTWGVDFGLLDAAGHVLANPLHYRDAHTDGIMQRTFARVAKEKIFAWTGIQFMQFNSLFQLVALRQDRPELLERAHTLLMMPDLFNYLLTGQKKSEYSVASTTQMLDARRRGWCAELIDELDLPRRILPEIVPSGTVLGALTREVADECGVAQTPVIAPGCHDTASAVAAVPAEGNDWCYISSGTWSLMGVECAEPIINDKTLRYNYTNEGGVGGRIRLLKNIMGMWPIQQCRREWAKMGQEYSYAQLTQMAREARAGGAMIDPNDQRFLAPGDMAGTIERFCMETKQNPPRTPGEVVRCCLESLALSYRRTLEGLEDVVGPPIGTIHIVGGGSQNEFLNQMAADACGRTVAAGPVEATAAGNVLVQAMALGRVRSIEDLRHIVRNSFDVKRYEPRDPQAWESAYDRYRGVVSAGGEA